KPPLPSGAKFCGMMRENAPPQSSAPSAGHPGDTAPACVMRKARVVPTTSLYPNVVPELQSEKALSSVPSGITEAPAADQPAGSVPVAERRWIATVKPAGLGRSSRQQATAPPASPPFATFKSVLGLPFELKSCG